MYLFIATTLSTYSYLLYFNKTNELSTTVCQIQAFFLLWFEQSQFIWSALISYTTYKITTQSLGSDFVPPANVQKGYLYLGFIFPFANTAFAYLNGLLGESGHWCWISNLTIPGQILSWVAYCFYWAAIIFNAYYTVKLIMYVKGLNIELKEKEISTKIRIRRTLNDMKLQSSKLDGFKKDYIEKARQAALINNKQTYNLAKQGLKLCLSKQRFLDSMVANFEIALQMNEMNKVINGFVSGMNLIADEMKGVTSTIDIAKAQAAYEKALASNQGQYEALDAFLREAEGSIESFAGNENDVSEDELDMLINNEACDSEDSLDKEIDEKIANVRQKMKV